MYFPLEPSDICGIKSDSTKRDKMASSYERVIATGYYLESENIVTRSFSKTIQINDIITWACECGISGNLIITIDESKDAITKAT
jgi:hypothetical protein